MRQLDTSPSLISLMQAGLTAYFNDTANEFQGNEDVMGLTAEQERIGWHQVLLGRMSCKWGQIQTHYLHSTQQTPQHHNHGSRWTQSMIQYIWHEVRLLWNIRNEARHGKDEETRQERELLQVQQETEWLYQSRPLCHPNIQSIIFHSCVAEHFVVESSLQQLKAWIQLHKTTILSLIESNAITSNRLLSRNKPNKRQHHRTLKQKSLPISQRRVQVAPKGASNGGPAAIQEFPIRTMSIRTQPSHLISQMRTTFSRWLGRTTSIGTGTAAPPQQSQSLRQGLPKVKMKLG